SDVEGWYLRLDKTVGLGTDGEFYVLTAPLGLLDRVRGATLRPTPPPLVIGAGGKAGDSIAPVAALDRLLPGWRCVRHDPCTRSAAASLHRVGPWVRPWPGGTSSSTRWARAAPVSSGAPGTTAPAATSPPR